MQIKASPRTLLFFATLITRQVDFITRLKAGAAVQVVQVFTNQHSVRDQLIKLGTGRNSAPILTLRLVEIRVGKNWYSYITSVVDPTVLPPYVVADLYRQRWRIEEAFNTVKRLLGLSYLWTGSINGVKLQVWATWLFYAVLVDVGDAITDELALPFDRISLEMVYGDSTTLVSPMTKAKQQTLLAYFASPENQDLGVVKSLRKTEQKIDLSPFPERKLPEGKFHHQPS